jgi:transposase
MTYSLDLRERVVGYIRTGTSRAEASRIFKIAPRTISNWLERDDLSPTHHGSRRRKIDKAALVAHVRDYPDVLLRERAGYFNVSIASLWSALRKLNITKKNEPLR